jgi:hypothetical protein
MARAKTELAFVTIRPNEISDNINIHGPMARISAFQADGSGSIPDGCNFLFYVCINNMLIKMISTKQSTAGSSQA